MIAKVGPKREFGRGSFSDLRTYLERDDSGKYREDLVCTWSSNVGSHLTADIEMEHIARRGKAKAPVYHLILSWRPGESVAQDVVRAAIDITLRSLGAEDYQWFAAAHRDDDDSRTHLHIAVNKVHPVSARTLNCWREQYKLARATEWVESEFGCLVDRRTSWREKIPELDLGLSTDEAHEHVLRSLPAMQRIAPDGAAQKEMDAARRAGYSWVTLLQREAVPAVLAQAAYPGATWQNVHATLETYGVHLERAGSGLRVIGPEIAQRARGSRIGLVFEDLESRLGPYEACRAELQPLEEKLPILRQIFRDATSWNELHGHLAGHGLAVEERGRGGRLLDLADGQQSLPLGRLGTSMPRLVDRLGEYVLPNDLSDRLKREAERGYEGVAERLVEVAKNPQGLIERVAAHNSVWTLADVEYELARIIGVNRQELLTHHVATVGATVRAVVRSSLELGSIPGKSADKRECFYSTPEIVAVEKQALEAFFCVHERSRPLHLRAASVELDEQQRAAFDYLADGSTDLRCVTGIAGAGKSRLLRDVSAAYAEAGFTVIGTAVAGDAARTLGEEAAISALTTARLLADIEKGRLELTPMTVVILDEATQLGTADGLRLAQHLNRSGTRLLATGDLAQHESVARGPILSEIAERIEIADLSETRRASAEWLRRVGKDMREGRTTRALDTLREHGAIGEYETRDEAMRVLVERYVADVQAGRTALMVATTRHAVDRLNVLAREALGDRLGERREYVTSYGVRDFAIGDHVVTRRGVRDLPASNGNLMTVVNGEQWGVVGHGENGRLELENRRLGVRVDWDLVQCPEIDWSMATTSYRSQGRTVDAAYVLVTEADARRGLYVDVTRARSDVLVAYAREDIVDFGEFLAVGGRERVKMTVASAERYIAQAAAKEDRSADVPLREVAERWEPKRDRDVRTMHDSAEHLLGGEREAQRATADIHSPKNTMQSLARESNARIAGTERDAVVSLDYAAVEADALAQVADPVRFRDLIAAYRDRFGDIVDTDNARNLFDAYAHADNETRSRLSSAVHAAASLIAQGVWNQRILEPADSFASSYVVLFAGGAGSGKGTAIEAYRQHIEALGGVAPHVMWDTTLSDISSARAFIDQALEHGKDVEIRYVHRPIELAMEGVRERQLLTGRSVPDQVVAATHFGAQQTLAKLLDQTLHDERISISIYDNSGNPEELCLGSFEKTIKPGMYQSLEDAFTRIPQEKSHEQFRSKQPEQAIARRTDENARSAEEHWRSGHDSELASGNFKERSTSSRDTRAAEAGKQFPGGGVTSGKPPAYVTLSVTRVGWKLEPIAEGTTENFSSAERSIAKMLIKELRALDPQEQLRVMRDTHALLRNSADLKKHISDVRNAAQYRSQSRSQSYDRGLER